MLLSNILLPAIILALPCRAQDNTTLESPGLSACNSDDIENMDVMNCLCQARGSTCMGQRCDQGMCGTTSISSLGELVKCGNGCTTPNIECSACNLWFRSLCICLKDIESGSTTTNCKASGPLLTQNPVWMLLSANDLITTTQLLPGILELSQAHDPEGGWTLGQDTYNRSQQGLAINSVQARSEEQIHIHVCPFGTKSQDLRDTLSHQKYSNYVSLADVPGFSDLQCRVAPQRGIPITDVAKSIKDFIAKPPSTECDYYVGAGVLTDNNDFTWMCISTARGAAEFVFCH